MTRIELINDSQHAGVRVAERTRQEQRVPELPKHCPTGHSVRRSTSGHDQRLWPPAAVHPDRRTVRIPSRCLCGRCEQWRRCSERQSPFRSARWQLSLYRDEFTHHQPLGQHSRVPTGPLATGQRCNHRADWRGFKRRYEAHCPACCITAGGKAFL